MKLSYTQVSAHWLSLIAAMLLVGLASWWSQQPPERYPAETVFLDGADATPERGHAYRLSLRRIAPGLASDKDSVSRLVFLESGTELTGRALHADIRSRGGGLYSHWGSAILFSTRDGSDPRTNGQRYEVRLPPRTPAWHRHARLGLVVAAMLLLLIWVHGMAGSLLKALLWAFGGLAAIAILALGAASLSSPVRDLRAIRETVRREPIAESIAVARARESVAAEPLRTRHLLRGEVAPAFTTDAPPPAAAKSRLVRLRPTEGAVSDRGFVDLGGESVLRNVEPFDLPASDLESMVLKLEVARGGSMSLQLSNFEDLDSSRQTVRISFSLSASPEAQTLRFRRPALGKMDRVRHVVIRAGPATGKSPIVRVESLRYSLRLDAFAEQHSGFNPVDLRGSLRPTLWQGVPGRFTLPLEETDGTLLKLAVGTLAQSPEAPIDFAVSVIDHNGRQSTLHRGSVKAGQGWRELRMNLPEEGVRELLLEGERLPPHSALMWSGARLIDRQQPPRRLVLILADTLRADALGCYGHEGNPTPSLDALASQGARFERAFAQSYWTRPSMASIMTGRYVAATGVQALDEPLPDIYETLAERLAGGGFTTVGVVTNTNAGPHAGLDQGFDRMRLTRSLRFTEQTEKLIAEAVLPTLDELEDDDIFLYLHLMETHGPYGPAEPPPDDFRLPVSGSPLPPDPQFDRAWSSRPTAAQRVALYEYDVRSMDRALGDFFAHLDQRWRSPEGMLPMLAFVSDHGEHLGERDQWGHGFSDLFPENVQVPMMIRAPGHIAPGTRISAPVEIRHLAGTLLDLVGLVPQAVDPDAMAAWRSLLPVRTATADSAAPPFAVSAAEEADFAAFSLFGQQYGYVARITQGTPRIAIFPDPGLDRQLTTPWPRPVLEQELLRVRRSYLESQGKIRERLRRGLDRSAQTIDPQALEDLKALGYLQD